MGPGEIKKHLRRRPFQPFRVFVSDGSSYDVRHPELAYVSRSEVVIGLDAANGDLPDRSIYIAPLHVTRIEPIDGAKARRRPKKRS